MVGSRFRGLLRDLDGSHWKHRLLRLNQREAKPSVSGPTANQKPSGPELILILSQEHVPVLLAEVQEIKWCKGIGHRNGHVFTDRHTAQHFLGHERRHRTLQPGQIKLTRAAPIELV
jgi:hypothetical protein